MTGTKADKRSKPTKADIAAAERLKKLWQAAVARRKGTDDELSQDVMAAILLDATGKGTQGLISQYINGKIPLNYRAVVLFAKELGCDPTDIRNDLPELKIGNSTAREDLPAPVHVADGEIPSGYLRLPQLDLPAGAGPGVEMEAEPDVVRWIDVAEQWAEKHFNGHVPRIRVLTARGDSMVGAGIMSGDLLFVDSGITRYDGDGYYILQFMDGWQVKRLRADVLTQQVEIVSLLASGEQAKPVPPAKLRELRIGGKVSAWWTLRKH